MKSLFWNTIRISLCLAIVSAFVVVTILAVSASHYSPLTNSINTKKGSDIFHARCISCHSLDPNGIAGRGPNLGTLNHRKPFRDQSLTDYLIESIVRPEAFRATEQYGYMPNVVQGLTQSQIADLVGFLVCEIGEENSLSELSFKYSSIEAQEVKTSLKREHASYATISKGREIFFGKGNCASCHNWLALEGLFMDSASAKAPSLRNIGTKPAQYIHESITEPSKFIVNGFESTLFLLEDGRTIVGRIVNESEANYVIVDSSKSVGSSLIYIKKSTIEEMKTNNLSTMPSYKDTLTEEELKAVLAFISYL